MASFVTGELSKGKFVNPAQESLSPVFTDSPENKDASPVQIKSLAIVLGYNVAGVLEKTLRSIPEGSVDEIVVIDDGSTDGTAEVARRLGVRVLTQRAPRNVRANPQITLLIKGQVVGA